MAEVPAAGPAATGPGAAGPGAAGPGATGPGVDRHVAALVLDEIAALLRLQDDDPFRAAAYRTGARVLDELDGDLAAALGSGELALVDGVGPGLLAVLRELVETGRSGVHERLRAETPAGQAQLRRVSGLGPKRVRTLVDSLGIDSLAALREAATAGRIAALKGFGPATQQRILDGIPFVERSAGRRRQPGALASAARLVGHLETLPVLDVGLTGEVRRRCETAGAVDLLAVSEACDAVLDDVAGLPVLRDVRRVDGSRIEGALADGMAVRVRCVRPEAAAAARVVDTGSASHVAALAARAEARGLRLAADGLWRGDSRIAVDDEEALYRALDLDRVPPELREGRGEVAAAAEHRLPRLVDYDDLRGTFHCHTTWSDGTATVAEMAAAARDRGWRYLGIADHSPAASYAGGLSVEQLRRQHEEIDAWNAEHGAELRLLKGAEADILADGRLDYPDDVLDSLDYVVGSVHSGFQMAPETMTARVTTAVRHLRRGILGHATGRLLLTREAYGVDVDAVLEAAAESGAAVEINADPARLDLDWRHWPRAKSLGIRCAINPDAHSTAGLGAVVYGVSMARKGWLEPEDVINTWELERVLSHFGRP